MTEKVMLFGKARSLVGILTEPSSGKCTNNLPGIILLNAGMLHRVGPNRVYVKIARIMAASGYVALRFDFSGIGDSKTSIDNLSFEKGAISETQEAMNYLNVARGIEQFILIGICSGAVISFKTACCDPRVVGAVPINAQGFQYGTSEEITSNIKNRHKVRYLWKVSLFNPNSWLKLIKGKADYPNIIRIIGFQIRNLFARNREVSSRVNNFATDLRSLIERGINLLFVYSELDPGWDEFHVMLGGEIHELNKYGKLRIEIIQNAGHTFTLLRNQEHLIKIILNWTQALVQE